MQNEIKINEEENEIKMTNTYMPYWISSNGIVIIEKKNKL